MALKSNAPEALITDAAVNFPKFSREVSVMAWIEDSCGSFLMVRQAQGKRLWTLPGGKVKANERLETALKRELREEIGERSRSMHPIAIFDRPEKRNLTVLFRVTLCGLKFRGRPTEEIASIAFRAQPPANSSPSAHYFYKLREFGAFGLY